MLWVCPASFQTSLTSLSNSLDILFRVTDYFHPNCSYVYARVHYESLVCIENVNRRFIFVER